MVEQFAPQSRPVLNDKRAQSKGERGWISRFETTTFWFRLIFPPDVSLQDLPSSIVRPEVWMTATSLAK